MRHPRENQICSHFLLGMRGTVAPCPVLQPAQVSPNIYTPENQMATTYSPEKWLHNRIYCPSNRSKQIQETHTAYSTGTQYARQSLNEKQYKWLHRRCQCFSFKLYRVYCVPHYKRVSFLDLVGPMLGNKSCYVITFSANCSLSFLDLRGRHARAKDWAWITVPLTRKVTSNARR